MRKRKKAISEAAKNETQNLCIVSNDSQLFKVDLEWFSISFRFTLHIDLLDLEGAEKNRSTLFHLGISRINEN